MTMIVHMISYVYIWLSDVITWQEDDAIIYFVIVVRPTGFHVFSICKIDIQRPKSCGCVNIGFTLTWQLR